MQEFEYVAPTSIEEAVGLMAEDGCQARALAGGTDILVQLRGGRFKIDRLVDLKKIPELNELSCSDDGPLAVGAAVPCYRIYEDPAISRLYPGLVDAASIIGGIQIQGRATIGGNLCNSSPSADTIPALIALEATCVLIGPKGRRTIPVEKFCTAPGKNALGIGELLVALQFPPRKPNMGAHYLRFIPRNEMDIAVVGVGASVVLNDSKSLIRSARVALAAVAPTPILAKEASDFLAGREPTESAIEEAAEIAKRAAKPISDMRGTARQRVHLVGVMTKRALHTAIDRAREAP